MSVLEPIIIITNSYDINMNHVLYWRNQNGNLAFRMSNNRWIVTTCPYLEGRKMIKHDLKHGYNPIELIYKSLPIVVNEFNAEGKS